VPRPTDSEARGCLGSLSLGGALADTTPIESLSGGQKVLHLPMSSFATDRCSGSLSIICTVLQSSSITVSCDRLIWKTCRDLIISLGCWMK
jgi:hypothetical protein